MVSIAMMLGGAIVNALAFTGSNFLFSKLKDNTAAQEEKERHDKALEQFTKARDEWSKERTKYLDLVNDRIRKESKSVRTFHDVNEALGEYYKVTGSNFDLPDYLKDENEPEFKNFYTPSDTQKNMELVWVTVGTAIVGIVGYNFL